MNIFLLYLLLLKGTATAFAGLASLPVIQDSLVIQRHVLTDTQLNEAVVITRSTPGPVGLYTVSVGYFVDGLPGAIAGWLAMITPALLIIPLVHFVGRKMEHPRVRTILHTVLIASAGLLLAAAIPLAQDALTGAVTVAIAAVSLGLLLTTKLDTLWIILGEVASPLSPSSFRVILHKGLFLFSPKKGKKLWLFGKSAFRRHLWCLTNRSIILRKVILLAFAYLVRRSYGLGYRLRPRLPKWKQRRHGRLMTGRSAFSLSKGLRNGSISAWHVSAVWLKLTTRANTSPLTHRYSISSRCMRR